MALKIFLAVKKQSAKAVYRQMLEEEAVGTLNVFDSAAQLLGSLHEQPDVVFLDYHLHEYEGQPVSRLIHQQQPGTCTIIIGSRLQVKAVLQLPDNGVFDFVVKGVSDRDRIKMIRTRIFSLKGLLPAAGTVTPCSHLISREKQKMRKTLAAELHDNINPLLAAAKLYHDTALNNHGHWEDYIRESKNILLSAIEEIRCLTRQYSAEAAGLENRLRDFFSMLQKQQQIHFAISAETAGLNQRLTTAAQKEMLPIVRELVNNLIRYSGTARAEIKLALEQDVVQLTVKDYGRGFDTGYTTGGTGIGNITRRVHRLKGNYVLHTGPGKGCAWHINIPLKAAKGARCIRNLGRA